MTNLVASQTVAKRVQEVRKKRGLTVKQLAGRCSELGAPELTASALYNLESGRRDGAGHRRRPVTVDELLALAYVLSVAPIHLLVPVAGDDPTTEPYELPLSFTTSTGRARMWIRGDEPIGQVAARDFFSEIPESEWVPPPLRP